MSNIHQNDELLRVQDENYDIVFNYDKHENGGVAVHAEKDGRNHKVNPEYARAALVKQIGSGGGWSSDLPKPSVGGYGYTEQGEQTVITWDGDTEGRVVVGDALCRFSDKTPTIDELVGGTYTTKYTDGPEDDTDILRADNFTQPVDGVLMYGDTFCVVSKPVSSDDMDITETGIYMLLSDNYYVSNITYDTPDTIHKIDEKYLPQSGGTTMVNITFDEDSGYYVADKTYDEIMDAIAAGVVVKCIIYNEDERKNFVLDLHSYDIQH